MVAYLIGQIRVKEQKLWREYVDGVARSLEPFAAEIVFRGRQASVLAGQNPYDLVVVIRFIDQVTLDRWFTSDAYQQLIPLRERAADVVITAYDA